MKSGSTASNPDIQGRWIMKRIDGPKCQHEYTYSLLGLNEHTYIHTPSINLEFHTEKLKIKIKHLTSSQFRTHISGQHPDFSEQPNRNRGLLPEVTQKIRGTALTPWPILDLYQPRNTPRLPLGFTSSAVWDDTRFTN